MLKNVFLTKRQKWRKVFFGYVYVGQNPLFCITIRIFSNEFKGHQKKDKQSGKIKKTKEKGDY